MKTIQNRSCHANALQTHWLQCEWSHRHHSDISLPSGTTPVLKNTSSPLIKSLSYALLIKGTIHPPTNTSQDSVHLKLTRTYARAHTHTHTHTLTPTHTHKPAELNLTLNLNLILPGLSQPAPAHINTLTLTHTFTNTHSHNPRCVRKLNLHGDQVVQG